MTDAEFLHELADTLLWATEGEPDRLRKIAGRVALLEQYYDTVTEERKDWARRFTLDGVTPWEWQQRALRVPPREPTEAMQRAMVDAMFDERGDLKWRELAKIARKGWRAAYDAAQSPSAPAEGKDQI